MSKKPYYIKDTDPPVKQRIMTEGLRLFASRGTDATSIRDIAEAASCTNPALYKHFESKDELALVLFETCYQEHLARIEKAVGDEQGFESQFHAYLACFARLFDEDRSAAIYVTNNLPIFWPRVSPGHKRRTVLTVTREMLELGRKEKRVSTSVPIDLQVALISGYLAQITRQLYLDAMKGTATKLVPDVEAVLRKGLG